MFSWMIMWHFTGEQNLSNEAYRVDRDAFVAKAEEMTEQYTVREEGDTGIPVVHPPPGSDVYLVARLWEWWPILELEKDQSYRLHLSSQDWQHGFSLQPTNINIQVHPDYDLVHDHHARRGGHVRRRLQRILRHRASPDARPHLRRRIGGNPAMAANASAARREVPHLSRTPG